MYFWEILVPTVRNNGQPYRKRFHKVWDQYVLNITNGITIMPKTIKGVWFNEQGKEYTESMIPVRIMCSSDAIIRIVKFTKRHYDQEAIIYYRISDKVNIYTGD